MDLRDIALRDGSKVFCVALGFLFVGFIVGGSIGGCEGARREREKCIEAGYGYYEVDYKTGVSEFKYGIAEPQQLRGVPK